MWGPRRLKRNGDPCKALRRVAGVMTRTRKSNRVQIIERIGGARIWEHTMLILECEGRHVREFHLCALDKERTHPRSKATGNRISSLHVRNNEWSRITCANNLRLCVQSRGLGLLRRDSTVAFNLHNNQKDEQRLDSQ